MGLFSGIGKLLGKVAPIALTAATGGISGLVAGGLDYFGSSQTNATNSDITNRQMQFQADMSSTAHQREVKDMIKAGINPVLSATGGSGASTPSGSSFTAQNALSGAANTARSAILLREQLKNIAADTSLKKSNERNANANTSLTNANAKAAASNADVTKAMNEAGAPFIQRAIDFIGGGANAGHSARALGKAILKGKKK